ncbi:MAG: TonB-dependent receptor [Phenylobacterium sp.]|nr:MAG: TonB-dependent receptor [Phenylobacterium sp.]
MRTGLICLALAAVPSLAVAQDAAPAKPPPKPAPAAKPAPHTVGEVVVNGQQAAVTTAIDRRSYSITGDLQAQTGSIGDALRNLPSVEVDVQGNISLRGDPNVTILIDGKPSSLFQGDNKAQALQSLPASQIERVEVITNPSAEFRADGTAGVINLISKKARGAGRTGSLRMSGGPGGRAVAGANLGYNSKQLSVTGDLTYRRDTQKQTTTQTQQNLDPATGGFDGTDQDQHLRLRFNSLSAHATLDDDLTAHTRIGLETHGNYTDFQLSGPTHFTQTDPNGDLVADFNHALQVHQKRAAAEAAANLRQSFDTAGEVLSASLSQEVINDNRVRAGQTATSFPTVPDEADQQRLNYHQRKSELKGDYVRPMAGGVTFKAGVDLEYDDNAYRNRGFQGLSPDALAPDAALTNLFLFRQTLSQAYVTYEQPFGDLTVLAGLRLEDTRIDLDQVTQGREDRNDYTKLFPSLHLAWKLSDSQQLSASYSHRIQRPDPLEFNAFRFLLDPLNFRNGNPALKPQETHSFELGWQAKAGPALYIATLYYRENFNGVADVVSVLPTGQFLSTRDNVAKSRAAGLELVANGRLTKTLTYNLSANAFWTELQPQPLGVPETRSALTGFGRGSLNWQVTPDDLVQVNVFVNGKRLTPQGYMTPTGALNLGYRRKLTDQLSLVFTAQDLFQTFRFEQVIDTPALRGRIRSHIDTPTFMAGFNWTFGGGRARDPAFDFGGGSGGGPQ